MQNSRRPAGRGLPRARTSAERPRGVSRWTRRALPVAIGGLLAVALPATAFAAPERVFELVTPAAKGGSDVGGGFFATADGNAVAYDSFAVLGDPTHALFSSTYVARREADGWKTTSMQASVLEPNPTLLDGMITAGLSADLSTVFSEGFAAFEAGDENGAQDVARVRDGASNWVSPSLSLPDANAADSTVAGASADGRLFVISTTKPVLADVPAARSSSTCTAPTGSSLPPDCPTAWPRPAPGSATGAVSRATTGRSRPTAGRCSSPPRPASRSCTCAATA